MALAEPRRLAPASAGQRFESLAGAGGRLPGAVRSGLFCPLTLCRSRYIKFLMFIIAPLLARIIYRRVEVGAMNCAPTGTDNLPEGSPPPTADYPAEADSLAEEGT